MKSRLLASTLLAASLLVAPAVAFAQTSAPPDSTGPSGGPSGGYQPAPKSMHHHAMRSTHMKHGTTTGMSSSKSHKGNKSTAEKPSSY
ncbi:hypothetical protein [Bradyrhizobium sp.]|uniref:hypothetical protein n=1 Tax=Bradyrhizobium sp. TaxID=376 RepID=UPI002D2B069E|nr:hypothetical protein [Bradyrhizobium sp.]HZR72646.1 hypothetical protein [Bradyrhizobium sp.]